VDHAGAELLGQVESPLLDDVHAPLAGVLHAHCRLAGFHMS